MGTLKLNSLSSRFDDLKILILGMFDILIITKTKLDDTLTHSLKQTVIQCRIDLIEIGNGGRVIIYVRKDIPSKFLRKHLFPNGIEEIFVEINFSKSKLQLCSTYNPPS